MTHLPPADGPRDAGSARERADWLSAPAVIAAVPHLLRCQPAPGDVVVIGLTHDVPHLAAKIATAGQEDLRRAWAQCAQILTATGADHAILVAFTGPEQTRVLHDISAHAGPRLRDVLRVQDGRWWRLSGVDATPPEGTPLPATDPADLDDLILALGSCLNPPTEDLIKAALQPGPAALLADVSRHLGALTADPAQTLRSDARAAFTVLDAEHKARQSRPIPLDPARAARLLLAVGNVAARDRCVPWHDDAAKGLWSELLPYSPPEWAAPVATLLAATEYQQGNGVHARIAADVALTHDPFYTLAGLLRGCLGAGIDPHTLSRGIQEGLHQARIDDPFSDPTS